MLIYCLKCKSKTDTLKVQKINNNRVIGICKKCGCKKSQFIKKS